MSEDFEDYLRIYVPKDLSLMDEQGNGWELEALLETVEEAVKAARAGKDTEIFQMVVEVPADLDRQELDKLFEVVATAAHEIEDRFPQRTWDVFVAGGVLSEEHSAEAAFRRVFDEREELDTEVKALRRLLHKLYRVVMWSESDLTPDERALFTKAYSWAEREGER